MDARRGKSSRIFPPGCARFQWAEACGGGVHSNQGVRSPSLSPLEAGAPREIVELYGNFRCTLIAKLISITRIAGESNLAKKKERLKCEKRQLLFCYFSV